MSSIESHHAVRNATFLMLQRCALVVGAALFALIIPRLMGPTMFGQFALLMALLSWFMMLTSMGHGHIIGRYVPEFEANGDMSGLYRLLQNILSVRILAGLVVSFTYFLITIYWLRDINVWVHVLLSITVFVSAFSTLLYTLFLGFKQAARWGMAPVIRRWVLLPMIIAGVLIKGLVGACIAILLSELVVVVFGVLWARPHLRMFRPRFDPGFFAPYMRFGLTFFVGTVLITTFLHSGEVWMKLVTRDYAEVGYYGLAFTIYLLAMSNQGKLTWSFAPYLTTLAVGGDSSALTRWAASILKWPTLVAVLAVYATLFLASDLIPIAFGVDYMPVASNLLLLTVALVVQMPGYIAHLMALVYERPKASVYANLLRLGVFWLLAFPFIRWNGSYGACVALLVATLAYSAFYTALMFKYMRPLVLRWILHVMLCALFLPLALLKSSIPVNVLLFTMSALGYVGVLFALRVVTPGEFQLGWRSIRSRGYPVG